MAVCTLTGQQFPITSREKEFCKAFAVPLPTTCPEERIRKLMAARNERSLYHRTCSHTAEKIISAYPPEVLFPVYKNEIWWGDGWDASEYGRPFDFSQPFFEQFFDLQQVVPREGTSIFNSENCDYNSHCRECKNCYMNSLLVSTENGYYGYWTTYNKDIMDCMYTNHSTLCYECLDIQNCYNCVLLQESTNCNDCFFSYQLRGCNNTLFCHNLNNKSFYAFNKPCAKEEFAVLRNKLFNGSYTTWRQAYQDFLKMRKSAIQRALHNIQCENVTGDHLYTSRNLCDCYDGDNNEDCTNVISLGSSKNVQDGYSIGWPAAELIYNSSIIRGGNDIACSMSIWFSNGLRYCDSCVSCSNCFGCIGLKHKQYHILNKEYSKSEYETLIPKLIEHMSRTGEWGQFFPPQCISFAYNETAGQDQMPLTKEIALQYGYRWREEDPTEYQAQTFEIPDNIADVPDTICKEVLACAETGRNYKIIPQELDFYRQMHLPIPRFHPDTRFRKKMKLRNPRQLWDRTCAKCSKPIQTTYSPDRPEIVYCEECYLQTVY